MIHHFPKGEEQPHRISVRLFSSFEKARGTALLLANELDERGVRHPPFAPMRLVRRAFSLLAPNKMNSFKGFGKEKGEPLAKGFSFFQSYSNQSKASLMENSMRFFF